MIKKLSVILGAIGGFITAVALLLNALQPYVLEKPVPSIKPEGYVQSTRDSSLVVKSYRKFSTPDKKE